MNQQYITEIQAANILIEQRDFSKGIEKLYNAIKYAEFTEQKIDIFNTIGRVNIQTNNFEHAIDSFKKSLSLHQELSEKQADKLSTNRAAILNNLGSIYLNRDVSQSIAYHNEALDIFKNQVEKDPETYQLHLANTFLSLGDAYYSKGDLYQGRKSFRTAIEGYAKIDKNTDTRALAANAYYQLGNIATDENNTTTAKDNLIKAMKLYHELILENPAGYRPLLAATNNNLAVIAKLTNNYGIAVRYYEAALEQYEFIILDNRKTFLPYYAATLNNLGIIYSEMHEIRDAQGQIETSSFTGFGTLSIDNIGDSKKKKDIENKEKAIKYYLKTLDIYNEISQDNPSSYLPHIATTLHNLGILYDEKKDYKNAIKYYNKALKIRKELAKEAPLAFDADVCISLMNIITMNQSLMEQNADLSFKSISLELLKEAQERIEKYTDNRPIIKSIKSDIAYYINFYNTVDNAYLDILAKYGMIDQLTEKITELVDPKKKLPFHKEIHDSLLELAEKYPMNEKVIQELLKSYVDYSWIAIRSNDLSLAKKLLDEGFKIEKESPFLNINLGHYHLLKGNKSLSDEIYNKVKSNKFDNFEKIIEEDLQKMKYDKLFV